MTSAIPSKNCVITAENSSGYNVTVTDPSLPTALYRAEQVRQLDAAAIGRFAIPGMTLMENAGAAAWALLASQWPGAQHITVLCGAGNNAGDGYVIARLAAAAGRRVRVIALREPDRLGGDAGTAAQRFLETGQPVQAWSGGSLGEAEVIVDALLGTGLDREVTGAYREVIDAANVSDAALLAVDIPSGLHADTGAVMGTAAKADHTISFIGLKQGLFTGQGREFCGTVHFGDLGVPPGVYEGITPASTRIDLGALSAWLSPRRRTAHKGAFGHVLVIGGDYGFAGAARMAGEAAARTGAGLVSVATRPEHAFTLTMARPELMARGVDKAADLNPLLARANVAAPGPGLGQSDWSQRLLARCLESELPLVVDADALNLLAREPAARGNWVLTPHPGEAGRLLGCSAADVEADRFAAIRALGEKYGGVIVLKGSGSLVLDEEGGCAVCDGGNPGMASGGMGDVLTGVIAGLLAQGLPAGRAAVLGVCLHAAAADRAAGEGERGLLATDLLPWIRRLANP
jgi:hydroxyethylthiazole kinase-like uncharacterized protein yjeF